MAEASAHLQGGRWRYLAAHCMGVGVAITQSPQIFEDLILLLGKLNIRGDAVHKPRGIPVIPEGQPATPVR